MDYNRANLFSLLNQSFNDSELRTLCFTMHIDYDSIIGQGKGDKIRELILYCERVKRIEELETAIQWVRSQTNYSNSQMLKSKETGGLISRHTERMVNKVITQTKEMSNVQLIIFLLSLIVVISTLTLFLNDLIEQHLPNIWIFLSSFYFLIAIISVMVSKRNISVFIHIIINITVLSIIFKEITVFIILSGVFASIVFYVILSLDMIPEDIRYILSIPIAYISGIPIAIFLQAGSVPWYAILGSFAMGILAYFIKEAYKGIEKARYASLSKETEVTVL